MLRSGYSSDAVLRELAARHFADAFDSSVEEQLKRAGANESLLTALRTGSYAATASEISAAKEKATVKQKPTAPAEPVIQSPAAAPPKSKFSEAAGTPAPVSPHAIYDLLQGNLLYLERGELRKFDDELVRKKKLFLLFVSSNSSELARTVTSSLVSFYRRAASTHPEFETIFVSQDRTAFLMESYIHQAEMPWPAVVFEKTGSKFAGRRVVYEVPSLVLVSGDGKILYTSPGIQNGDMDRVIANLDKILATSSADPLAPPPMTLSKATDYFRSGSQ